MSSREYPDRPIVGIGVAMLRAPGPGGVGAAVLLVRRARPPGVGTWSLPGGAQKLGETAETAARRELLEETALPAGPLLLAAHVDSIHHDTDGRVQYHYTILDFAAAWQQGEPKPGSDVSDAQFVGLDDLEPYRLTAEAHRVIGLARSLLGFG